ncbi:murein transglycosylase A [Novosphingobium olei]|uniref:peptidoglycan lytic exotransglycosylase n=1 Tax=Novosphingobium olei TaxID=2728851 RepID=A0A7Y0BRD9_9SPHN|nr:murein transglycosylase A [Novosphingobium olei]NML95216.1 murein transglycosylase A [Novosphingobium olei]
MNVRTVALLALFALLAACGRVIPEGGRPSVGTRPQPSFPQTSSPSSRPLTAALIGVRAGPATPGLGFTDDSARAALASFVTSCPRLTRRPDASGLTQPSDWAAACAAAATWPASNAASFFATWFETAQVGDGSTYVTGYFEPEIAGVRTRQPGFDVPVYAVPPDLVRARPGDAPPLPDGRTPLGRYDETGRFVPYWDRAAIEDGALAGKGLEIAWAADPAEFFFLQIQGSGRLRAPDGTVLRIGYGAVNGYDYTGIGTIMASQGLIGTGPGQYPGSMQGILRYIREHPVEGRALMRQNRSYVFIREITGDGPVGALGVPVKGRTTLAADPQFVPLGAPVFLSTDRPEVGGLWVAQDTGGAIKGANRFDSFWGAGAEARRIAGGMSARGRALILLPKGTLARLGAR